MPEHHPRSRIVDVHQPVEQSVGGGLTIRSMAGLASLDGLENLEAVGGDFALATGNFLTIEPMNLETVGGRFVVSNLDDVLSLAGLQDLTEVGTLEVGVLLALTDLDALANLTTVNGLVEVNCNDSLTSVAGLGNLRFVGGDLEITDNPSLSTADAEALVDAIGRENIYGEVIIERNGP